LSRERRVILGDIGVDDSWQSTGCRREH